MNKEHKKGELLQSVFFEMNRSENSAAANSGENSLAGIFSNLIDVMDIAMWHIDLDYRVVGYNKKAKEIYGENAIGNFCYKVTANRETVCEICPTKMVYEGQESGRSEHKRTDAEGNPIYIDHIATPIRDAGNRVIGALVLIIDITRHKSQEKELLEHRNNLEKLVLARTRELKESQDSYRALYEQSSRAEKIYRSLLNSSADAIVIYNLTGEVEYLSPSFNELFGWKLDELRGKKVPFVPESEKESTNTEIRRLLTSGEPLRNFRTKRYTKDGRLLDIYISASKYDDHDGNPLGLLAILKDVTEVKSMERQLYRAQKLEALATLCGGIAHDFNNLLMGIQGNTSLLLVDSGNHDRVIQRLKNIESNVQRGANLTKQLLGLSRGGKYQVLPTDINTLIRDCSRMFGLTNREILINRYLSDDIWPVEVDRGQMEQVLLNILVNAGQAMPHGGELSLTTKNVILDKGTVRPHNIEPGKYVQIVITDTGTGIDDSIKDKIFDPFFTTKEAERGTGLGLASAYGIVSNHHGMITVASEVGKGSTFTICLPASTQEVHSETTTAPVLIKGYETILLVDDEKMLTDVGNQLLTRLGYRVLTASSGNEALEILEKGDNRVDLVILDMIMPGLSGWETFDRLKAMKPGMKTLLSSGYSLDDQAADILQRGCNGFLQKPFTIDNLSVKIRQILDDSPEK